MEYNEIITAIRDRIIAGAVDVEQVKIIDSGNILVLVVVPLDVRARVMTSGKPVLGGARRVISTADVQNSQPRAGKLAPGKQEFRRADMHRNSQFNLASGSFQACG